MTTAQLTRVAVDPRLPQGWRAVPAAQQPAWPDPALFSLVVHSLAYAAPLVSAHEVFALRRSLSRVAHGRGFVVQAGDCAETFAEPTFAGVAAAVQQLRGAARVMADKIRVPVVPIGRIAGQYGKPRSSGVERVGELELPSFRGYNVNGPAFTAADRRPDPLRLIRGHEHAAATLALLRELAGSGLAMAGHWGSDVPAVWTSHEALVLDYEDALVRPDPVTGAPVLTSTHLPWVGLRTNDPDGAHVRLLAEVANPVGCKLGPTTTPEQVAELCARLDPDRQPGRLVLIARFGADQVEAKLPPLVRAVAKLGHPVVWMCDPMHGNTVSVHGRKTRRVRDVLAEVAGFVHAVRAGGGWPGGVHLEATPADVTECVDRPGGLVTEDDLHRNYTTACDPRLNSDQMQEVVRAVAALCGRP
ncbi:MAG TPA: 3-deoxy-7-phosphoheptulonate synthase [Mycobacteriales bacterium]|nr:3-deoxy-7-phosphoheptulonate synthase [Mycobacteriales bacterium]